METGAEAIKLTEDEHWALLILFKMVTGFFKSVEDVIMVGFTFIGCSLKAAIHYKFKSVFYLCVKL